MWLFWIWGAAALFLMAVAQVPPLLGFGSPGGDNSIVFGFAALAGLPAWLVLAALALTRWRKLPAPKLALQLFPSVLAAVLFVLVQLRWQA